jgi:hypothetical protein
VSSDGDGDVDADGDADADRDSDTHIDSDGDADSDLDGDVIDTTCDDLGAVLLCDGFEDDLLSAWSRSVVENGSVDRVTDPVHRGSGALSAQSIEYGGRAMIEADLGSFVAGDIFSRAYLYVPSDSPVENVPLINLSERYAPWDHIAFEIDSDDFPAVWIHGPALYFAGSGTVAPRDMWFCVRLHVVISASDGAIEVWVDDELAIEASGIDTLAAGGIEKIAFGITWSLPDEPPCLVYVDDVIVDTSPLTCDM